MDNLERSQALQVTFKDGAKFEVSFVATYTYAELKEEFEEYMDDHDHTMSGLEEFIYDRFISPNFDHAGKLSIKVG